MKALDDVGAIRQTLRSVGRVEESLSWIGRPWIIAFAFGPALLMLLIWGAVGTATPVTFATIALSCSTYFSFLPRSRQYCMKPKRHNSTASAARLPASVCR